jgi:CheY-like chemotaxis protein
MMAKILVADDNPAIRELYSLEFEGMGHEVVFACNGTEALDRCRAAQPDVVVLDIGMPDRNGLEVLGELAAMHGGTPVIVNTAYPMFKMDYRAHRARAWLTKSSNPDALKETVSRVLGTVTPDEKT